MASMVLALHPDTISIHFRHFKPCAKTWKRHGGGTFTQILLVLIELSQVGWYHHIREDLVEKMHPKEGDDGDVNEDNLGYWWTPHCWAQAAMTWYLLGQPNTSARTIVIDGYRQMGDIPATYGCWRVKNHLVTGMHPQAVPECTPLRLMAIPGDGGIEAEAACPWFGQPSCRWCFSSLVKPSSCLKQPLTVPDVLWMYSIRCIYLMVEENMLVLE